MPHVSGATFVKAKIVKCNCLLETYSGALQQTMLALTVLYTQMTLNSNTGGEATVAKCLLGTHFYTTMNGMDECSGCCIVVLLENKPGKTLPDAL